MVSIIRTSRLLELGHQLFRLALIQFDIQQAIVGGISAALASQAGKPKGGAERDGCGRKKDFVAFLFIHHNVLEAL